MTENVCSFFGHRKVEATEELKNQVRHTVERLITEKGVDTFLFGSKSQFNEICYLTVTHLKTRYPHIRRVYVRAEYPNIDEDYESYLFGKYESTYYPERIIGARRARYVERNYEMIDKSRFCVVYYDENAANVRKSGTKIALDYATAKGKTIYRITEVRYQMSENKKY